MTQIERCIIRNPELIEQIEALRTLKHLSRSQLAKEAGIGLTTMDRIYHPEDPKGVSKERFTKVVVALTDDPQQRMALLRSAGMALAGIDYSGSFAQRVNQEIEGLNLNTANQVLLEEFVLSQIQIVGGSLREAQQMQEQLQRNLPGSRRTRKTTL